MPTPVTPCFMFDGRAEDAVNFYTGLVPDSRILHTTRYGDDAPMPKGTVMSITFELQGRPFFAVNGPTGFEPSMMISMMLHADTQDELDRYWDALAADGGQTHACGWVSDRFGVAWQVVPSQLDAWMAGDADQCDRVVKALWSMVKLDIAALERAAAGEP